jgi:bla regulator protein blaR1
MANLSGSHFLQALGWATLNSFWQMALLWILYLGASYLFKLPSFRKYQFSVVAVATGFLWFLLTFFYYLNTDSVSSIALFTQTIDESNNILQMVLLSASIAYLSLLAFPSYRLYRNWRFVQVIKKQGLNKIDFSYRLFVQRVAAQLEITKKVMVYVSDLVKSPVTIGYLKPIILVPAAALSNLSTQQVEAILLHELSHIRRYDYLVNFVISIINTMLYFNPFVKQFMKTIEEERENCCDELVLQFGYDKVGYASALLTLEKLSSQHRVLALCATGKNYLLSRIEKIVGMEKKKSFKRNNLAGLLAALLCIVAFNSILIINEKGQFDNALAYDNIAGPFNFFDAADNESHSTIPASPFNESERYATARTEERKPQPSTTTTANYYYARPVEVPGEYVVQAAQDDIDASLTREQKDEIRETVDATKKIVSALQWKVLDQKIGDAMTEQEKLKARQVYMTRVQQSDEFRNLEQCLKASYEKLDWDKINTNVNQVLVKIQLDSLQTAYNAMITQLDKARVQVSANATVAVSPMPDQSMEEIEKSRVVLQQRVECIKAVKTPKKIVKL